MSKKQINLILSPLLTFIMILPILWVVNDLTGIFTYYHIKEQETLVNHIESEENLDSFIKELESDSESIFVAKRKIAAVEAGILGVKNKKIIEILTKLKEDSDQEVRNAAEKSLNSINTN